LHLEQGRTNSNFAFWSRLRSVSGLVSVVAFLILLAPPLQPNRLRTLCLEEKTLGHTLHYVKNCDSYAFIRLAHDPSQLFERDSIWQSRPGYPVLGWIGSLPFRAVESLVARIAVSRFVGRRWFQPQLDVYYAGYILVNWIVLAGSGILFLTLVPNGSLAFPVFLPLVMLIINGVTKGFFWTPHTQVFNVLIPVLSCAAGVWAATKRPHAGRYLTLLGLCCGVASLIYGAFLLVFLTATLSILWSLKKSRALVPTWSLLLSWVAFGVPLVAWRQFVVWKTGGFYLHEVAAYHQFTWIVDSLKLGVPAFFVELINNFWLFAQTIVESLLEVLVLTCLAVAICKKASVSPTKGMPSELKIALGSFVAVAVPFFALMGYYAPRLSWELAPPLLIILAWMLSSLIAQIQGRVSTVANAVLLAVAIAYAIGIVAMDQSRFLMDKDGPQFHAHGPA
jgi:hypothetical protein